MHFSAWSRLGKASKEMIMKLYWLQYYSFERVEAAKGQIIYYVPGMGGGGGGGGGVGGLDGEVKFSSF